MRLEASNTRHFTPGTVFILSPTSKRTRPLVVTAVGDGWLEYKPLRLSLLHRLKFKILDALRWHRL